MFVQICLLIYSLLPCILVGILAILKVCVKLPANMVGVGKKDTISSDKLGGIFSFE